MVALAGNGRRGHVSRGRGGVAPGNGRIYVANWFTNDVSVIDTNSLKEIARIAVGDGSRAIYFYCAS
ncbi:MAG: hypothetical protein ACREYC_21250 [Gammaproteobacteria bacterium]